MEFTVQSTMNYHLFSKCFWLKFRCCAYTEIILTTVLISSLDCSTRKLYYNFCVERSSFKCMLSPQTTYSKKSGRIHLSQAIKTRQVRRCSREGKKILPKLHKSRMGERKLHHCIPRAPASSRRKECSNQDKT